MNERVDVVSLALPDSDQIGEVFSSKGFKHVLCFGKGNQKD